MPTKIESPPSATPDAVRQARTKVRPEALSYKGIPVASKSAAEVRQSSITPVSARRTAEATAPDVERLIGPFLLKKKIGVGGMGIVYKATYTKNGAQCAVKVLPLVVSANPLSAARFEREITILKKLKHPHIVKFYGGGEHEGQRFYAMEFVDGGTLEKIIKDKGQLPWEQVVDYGIQLCKALGHAHKHGIVHRDLKPANLFIGKNDKLRLGDFGIARDSDEAALTANGTTVGTQAYMAPEQITGKQPISNKTDLYALGCLLFEMLTGHPPFQGATVMEALLKHINAAPPKVRTDAPDCPIFLEQIILHLLEKSPDKRPRDALAVQGALEEVAERVTASASTISQMTAGTDHSSMETSQQVGVVQPKKPLGKKKSKKSHNKQVAKRPGSGAAWLLSAAVVVLVGGIAFAMWPG